MGTDLRGGAALIGDLQRQRFDGQIVTGTDRAERRDIEDVVGRRPVRFKLPG